MHTFLRKFLLISSLLSLVLLTSVHENFYSHDNTECSICIFQPLSDPHSSTSGNSFVAKMLPSGSVKTQQLHLATSSFVRLFDGRAPPVSA